MRVDQGDGGGPEWLVSLAELPSPREHVLLRPVHDRAKARQHFQDRLRGGSRHRCAAKHGPRVHLGVEPTDRRTMEPRETRTFDASCVAVPGPENHRQRQRGRRGDEADDQRDPCSPAAHHAMSPPQIGCIRVGRTVRLRQPPGRVIRSRLKYHRTRGRSDRAWASEGSAVRARSAGVRARWTMSETTEETCGAS